MNRTAKNTVIYLVGTIILALAGFVNTMLLTRVLDPHVYAEYGLATAFESAMITILSLGFDAALTRFYYSSGMDEYRLFMKCLRIPIALFVLFLIVMMEPNHFVAQIIFGEDLSLWMIALLGMYVFLALVLRFSQIAVRMEERAINYVSSSIVAKVGYVLLIVILTLGRRDIQFDSVLYTFIISNVLALLINCGVFFRTSKGAKIDGAVSTKALFDFGFPIAISNSLVLIIPVIERIIVRDIAGWKILSIYTAAAIFQTVVGMVTMMVDNIWSPIVYRKYENEKQFKPIMHAFGMAVTLLTIVGMSLVILLRRWLVLILDKQYFDVFIIAPAIFCSACMTPITSIMGVGINIKKKTVHCIISPVIQIVISTILCYLLIPKLGLTGIGVSIVVSIYISRLYRIVVGLTMYNTGTSELKSYVLWIISGMLSLVCLFSTTLTSDIIVAIGLLVVSLGIVNKDCSQIISLIRSNLFKV